MRYRHVKPTAEQHLVEWDMGTMPGIMDPEPRRTFGSAKIHPNLAAWLDEHASPWSLRTDWDYSNAGDDDEGCHLTVPSREAGEAFIERASRMSTAWRRADHERKPLRVFLAPRGLDEVEIHRAHKAHTVEHGVQDELRRRDVSSDRRTASFAGRDAYKAFAAMAEDGTTERRVALRPAEALRVPADIVMRVVATEPTAT